MRHTRYFENSRTISREKTRSNFRESRDKRDTSRILEISHRNYENVFLTRFFENFLFLTDRYFLAFILNFRPSGVTIYREIRFFCTENVKGEYKNIQILAIMRRDRYVTVLFSLWQKMQKDKYSHRQVFRQAAVLFILEKAQIT